MVIRRIREHATTHNWFAVAIDLAIVVVGVFLGTQVSNWNQARIGRAQGHDYRDRLILDIHANETDLRDRIDYYGAVKRHAEAALEALERPSPGDAEALLIHAYEASQINPRKIKRFTYDEILSTGGIERLGDAPLREQIANYYIGIETTSVTFNFVPPYREHIRQVMPNFAQQRVRQNCREKFYLGADGSALARLAKGCSLGLDRIEAAKAAAIVRASPGIAGDLTRLIGDLDVKLALVDSMLAHMRKIRSIIEERQRR